MKWKKNKMMNLNGGEIEEEKTAKDIQMRVLMLEHRREREKKDGGAVLF